MFFDNRMFPQLRVHCLAAAAALTCLANAAAAQQAVSGELQEVVVTASGMEQAIADAPASISVITQEDLQRKPVQELADILGTIQGVTLNRSGNGTPTVQIRGLGAAYTLMLIDGKRVNATSVMFRGNDYDTGWVPVSEIERIEVVRGPMSSLYGSDAIGGVVNIITKKVGDRWRGDVRLETVQQGDSDAGNSQLANFSLAGPLKSKELGLKIYGGYDLRRADSAQRAEAAEPVHPLLRNTHMGAQLNWLPVQGHALKLDLDGSRRDHGGFVLKRSALALNHQGRYAFGQSDVTFSADRIRNEKGVVSGAINPAEAHTYALNGKLNVPLAAWNQVITLGGELRREELDDPTNLGGWPGAAAVASGTASVNQQALFIEDEIFLGEAWRLTLGNRLDHHANFGTHNSPRAYLIWEASEQWRIKGGIARSFRAPTLLQNSPNWGSVSCGSATTGCYIVGSTDLKPETGTSWELGASGKIGAVDADLTLFRTRLKNMISIDNRTRDPVEAATYPNFVDYLADGRPVFSYENVASVQTSGVEASLRAPLGRNLSSRLNYTYTKALDTSGTTDLPLTYRPRHSANLGLDWQADALSLGADWRFTGEQVTNARTGATKGGYSIVDIQLAWRINSGFTLRTGVLNLFDKRDARDANLYYYEDGRRYFVSLNAAF